MPSTSNPFGFRPVYHPTGISRAQVREAVIASGYGSSLYKYQPIQLTTGGGIAPVTTATQDVAGVFMGVIYTPSNSRPVVMPNWVANTTLATGTTAIGYYTVDPDVVYEVQADGSVAITAVGDQADITNFAANNGLGYSQATLSSSLVGAGNQGQFRIVDKSTRVDNAWGDAYTIVQAQIAMHPYVADKTAI